MAFSNEANLTIKLPIMPYQVASSFIKFRHTDAVRRAPSDALLRMS